MTREEREQMAQAAKFAVVTGRAENEVRGPMLSTRAVLSINRHFGPVEADLLRTAIFRAFRRDAKRRKRLCRVAKSTL
jgi:hypothetical protein